MIGIVCGVILAVWAVEAVMLAACGVIGAFVGVAQCIGHGIDGNDVVERAPEPIERASDEVQAYMRSVEHLGGCSVEHAEQMVALGLK